MTGRGADSAQVKRFACLALLALAGPVDAAETGLCTALAKLKTEARISRSDQEITVFKEEEMAFACKRRRDVAAQVSFCSAAAKAVGVEFTHAFPWRIHECLTKAGIRPRLTLADQYTGMTGRKKIRYLTGSWRDATRIEIRFVPTGDFGDEAEFKDYYGYYRLTISPR